VANYKNNGFRKILKITKQGNKNRRQQRSLSKDPYHPIMCLILLQRFPHPGPQHLLHEPSLHLPIRPQQKLR
jgi:hypothetical protein